jgi:hypothetical protein
LTEIRHRGSAVKPPPSPDRQQKFLAGDKVEKGNRPFPSKRHSCLIAIRSATGLRIDSGAAARFG